MPRALPEDIQANLKALLSTNTPFSDISKRLGISKGVISKYKKRWFPDHDARPGGRPSLVSETTKALIRRKVLSGSLLAAPDVHTELRLLGYDLTVKTATNVLKSMNFVSQIKQKKPLLSKKHQAKRLEWAKRYQSWTVEDWSQVVFSDETKINIWGSDGCKYFWTRPGDELRPHHIEVTVKHGGDGLMLWGCITARGPGYACQVYDGTMKSADYQHVLDTSLRETMEYYGMDWSEMYFQQDNAPPHRSASTMKWIREQGIQLLEDWPAQSPDLNPIEHVWHHLKLKLSAYERRATSVKELWERVDKEWNSFTEDECKRYVASMPKRIRAVIKAKGGYTRY
jgi:transposase